MRIDIENALAETASPGVPRDALGRLDDRVRAAHRRIEEGRENGQFGYRALELPRTVDAEEIRRVVEPFADSEAVLTVGIGGSSLGAEAIAGALDSPVDAYFLDNVDPGHADGVLEDAPLDRTAVNVVSRSGTTAETLANLAAVREAMARESVDWTSRTFVTTGSTGALRSIAEGADLPVLDVPEGVPGRFSVLSAVGLASAVIRGHDIEAMLAGARGLSVEGSLFDSPAYAYGALCYALDQRGVGTNVMMPYAEALAPFSRWFAQLWAESLGKDGVGQTPARAMGVTDQHSQLQLYRGGPRDKLVTFLQSDCGEDDRAIPASRLGAHAPEYLEGATFGEFLDAGLRATETSLAECGQPNVRLQVGTLDERSLGRLLYGMEVACVMAGELYGVETFTQPDVQLAKRTTKELLAADSGRSDRRESDLSGRQTTDPRVIDST